MCDTKPKSSYLCSAGASGCWSFAVMLYISFVKQSWQTACSQRENSSSCWESACSGGSSAEVYQRSTGPVCPCYWEALLSTAPDSWPFMGYSHTLHRVAAASLFFNTSFKPQDLAFSATREAWPWCEKRSDLKFFLAVSKQQEKQSKRKALSTRHEANGTVWRNRTCLALRKLYHPMGAQTGLPYSTVRDQYLKIYIIHIF